ncbi:Rieske 2Fe-2S domain-containing protein [Klenkia brasiliensis]|uniref:Rieske [2Fe-2S] domain-containing protein n=1 Tax=Klenkia brasiliensis TaxID=333142 RepID=A0A1G7NB40_9ACTN|nr:Rieske 2Fe-2S domain-containing protein [Klenkia brasiliensis]SDF71253.1 Rieske [2Fe-2S] domain-containing protein [Klenkia brasiliensis]
MALSRTPPSPGGTGWFPVARAADVGGTPLLVGAGGRPWVVVRLRPGGEVTALSPRCPHRLLPLTSAEVVGGELRCAGHGWTFAADGRCRDVPALGPDAVPPPRADLSAPWAVEERDGWVWVANDRTLHHRPPRAVAGTTAEPVPAPAAPTGPVVANQEPALARAWHPVARADQLGEGGWLAVALLGTTWTLQRRGGVVTAEPAAGVRERDGALWVAPEPPVTTDLPAEAFPGRTQWLPAVRTATAAAVLLDAVLDPGVPGVVPTTTPVPGGCTARWEDGGRRVVVHLRAPFQLRRDEVLADGTTRSLLLLLQPEDADSTLVHARVALGGRPSRVQLAAEADRVQAELAALDRPLPGAGTGLPLTPRDEVHLPTDRLGVAYRHALADLLVTARVAAEATEEDHDHVAAA